MYNFNYLLKNDSLKVKKEVTELLHLVQKEISNFSFDFMFVNASKYNIFLQESRNKRPISVYVNLLIEDKETNFLAKTIKTDLIEAINKVLYKNKFSYKETSDDVNSIRVISKDASGKRIAKSLNIRLIKKVEGQDMFIKYNVTKYNYSYNPYNDKTENIEKCITYLRNNMLWDDARALFLEKLNQANRKEDTMSEIFINTLNIFKHESGIFI